MSSDAAPPEKRTPEGGFAPQTFTAQGLGRVDAETRAVVPAMHPSTTYVRDPDGAYRSGRGYSRADNPTYDTPEELLARLEGGEAALLFSSGMAAAAAVFQALLPGDHVIAPRAMYWALRKWITDFPITWGLSVEFLDLTDLDEVRRAVQPGRTRLIWAETPANPTWEVCDIQALADIAHGVGARLAVDSTVSTPVITRPIEHGADLVVHSASKYLNGHSDVLAGAVVGAKRDPFWHRIRAWQRDGGAVLGPFEAWLLLRGMRTLFVRVERASTSATEIARHFSDHPHIRTVLYPGLPSHPGYDVACRQMSGHFGGMLSLRFEGGEAMAIAVAANVAVFKRATSLGGVESLIEHRASIEGEASPVPGDLLRLSVGLESASDLIWDIEQAIAAAHNQVEPAPLPHAEPTFGAAIERTLATIIRPVIQSRGGDIAWTDAGADSVELLASGSPGAVSPMTAWMQDTLSLQVGRPIAVTVSIAPAEGTETTGGPGGDEVQAFLDAKINGAVAAHGGRVRVVDTGTNRVDLVMDGRCQGCAMAEVTLRQGIEPALREAFPQFEVIGDVTDHGAGTDPFFHPGKAPALD